MDAALVGISAATLLVLAVSALFVVQEARLLNESVRANTARQMSDRFAQIDHIYVAHPKLREVFYEDEVVRGGRKLAREEVLRCHTIASITLDLFEGVLVLQRRRPYRAMTFWNHYIEDSFRNSRFLRESLVFRERWYPDDLFRIAGVERRTTGPPVP